MARRNERNARSQQEKRTNYNNKTNLHTQHVHEKYQQGGQKDVNGYHKFHLSPSQEDCTDVIQENTLTFIRGPAGTGKTAVALHYAVKRYLVEPAMKIIVIRTPVESGSDRIGFLPSDLSEKIAPHFSSVKNILEGLLTVGKVDNDINGPHKRIQFLIPNYALGVTWDNSIVIIDEAQMIQPLIMKLLLERIGVNSKVIVIGDPTQLYVNDKSRNGLSDAIGRFFKEGKDEDGNDLLIPNYGSVGYHEFNIDDMKRSDFVKTVIRAYSNIC